MEGHLEALLEMDFCTKPPNFGVEAHMEAPAGDALITADDGLLVRQASRRVSCNAHFALVPWTNRAA
jgi:hypothetical protein